MSSHPVPEPVLPEYGGACTSGIIPALVGDPDDAPDWMQASAVGADQTVVLVLDGLGWEQFRARQHLVPTLAAMDGRSITTVAPSTTATALTSITTGLPPGQHGVMGYRMAVDRDVLNVLRWTTYRGDARQSIPPRSINANDPFGSQRPPIVVRAEFEHSGFTAAHLHNARLVGYRMPSTMVIEVARLARAGEPFIYVYYDGIDKVAHEYGLGEHYEAELVAVEWMIKYLVEVLPPRSALVITADHGHIEVPTTVRPHPEVMSAVDFQSGEARFRWLHALPGAANELLGATQEHHSDLAWVVSRQQCIDDGWFGPIVTPAAASRLGDVAIVPFEPVAFEEPTDTGPYELVGRHGSLTAPEMLVPLLVARK
ncbi:MAG TPA: alkaline phosphatase family protein [Microthrixaceae bacterium]|nr:alkaline phosphatase family protein [Microthrixaceae bacterium]